MGIRRRLFYTVVLCLLLLLITFSAAVASRPLVMAGFDGKDTWRTWSDNAFFTNMEERTGLSLAFRQYPDRLSWTAAKAAMTKGAADLPDLMFKALLSPAECLDMLDRGVLIDLAPYLSEHCPNLSRLFAENPAYRQAVTLPGGAVAALPFITPSPAQNCLWINRRWLDTLKIPLPEDAAGFRATLEAFRDRDPNGNGKGDEIPLLLHGAYDLKYLAQAFGLIANDFNVFVQDGLALFMPLQPRFQDFVAWCAELYAKGLIDRDAFSLSASLRQIPDKGSTQRYGVLMAPLPGSFVPVEWVEDYVVIPPLVYEGARVWRNIASRLTTGTFAITTACPDPAAALAWVDTLYSQEGAILAAAGLEGVDYVFDGDGTWRRTESASQSTFLSDVSIMTGTTPPGISPDGFHERVSDPMVQSLSAQIAVVSSVATDPFPAFSLTREQENTLSPLQDAIGLYVDESIARWVIGEWEQSEEQWDSFHQELNNLGIDRFLDFWQQILDGLEEK